MEPSWKIRGGYCPSEITREYLEGRILRVFEIFSFLISGK
jgi:hypothetical protein